MLATLSSASVCLGRPSTRSAHRSLPAKSLTSAVITGCPSFGGQRAAAREHRVLSQCLPSQRAFVAKPVPSRFFMRSTGSGKYMSVLICDSCCSSALRGTAAPGPLVGSGASYRSRRAALCGVAANNPVCVQRAACSHPSPNPSVNRTSTSGLRPLAAAGYLKR